MALRTRKRRLLVRNRQEGHKRYVREQRHKTVKVAAVSALVLMMITLALGFAYAWYSGKNPIKIVSSPSVEVSTKPTQRKPAVINNAMRVGVSIQLISSPVAPGDNTTLTIHTNPLVTCSVEVTYDDKKSTDSGLKPKTADEFGVVTWSWTVEKTVPIGKWPAEVTCRNKKYSGVAKAFLEVKPKQSTPTSSASQQ